MQTSGHAAGTDNFYPRPPRGGRHIDTSRLPQTYTISIHALREEGDPGIGAKYFYDHIFLSTPSARRATHQRRKSIRATGNFYPRPPRGGRHSPTRLSVMRYIISIHALREEGDRYLYRFIADFGVFLSTPSARRATYTDTPLIVAAVDFYPRPPRGGRH